MKENDERIAREINDENKQREKSNLFENSEKSTQSLLQKVTILLSFQK